MNTFDKIRMALWQNRADKCSCLTGVKWRIGWEDAKDGVIPKTESPQLFGHALKLYGQIKIGEEIYLMAQLSNGGYIGDNGIFYFPEEVINRDFTYGAYLFKDMEPGDAKKLCWSWYQRLWQDIKEFFIELANKLDH